ncbi:hypothetical protein VTJ04DRAFT_5272 [Mycothermus thermophilus]|uniref:uncharacterized protein n=1 Tax=Humicola insolens TaxID=85995 RepID=UPI003743C102
MVVEVVGARCRQSFRAMQTPANWLEGATDPDKGNLELQEHEKQPLTNHGSLGTPASLMEKSMSGLRCCVRVRGSFFHESIPRPGRTGIWGRHLAGQPSSPEPVIAGRTAARRRKWPDCISSNKFPYKRHTPTISVGVRTCAAQVHHYKGI